MAIVSALLSLLSRKLGALLRAVFGCAPSAALDLSITRPLLVLAAGRRWSIPNRPTQPRASARWAHPLTQKRS